MSSMFSAGEQLTDWLALNDAIDEIAGGQTPCRSAPDVWFPRTTGSGHDSIMDNELRDAKQAKQLCITNCEVMLQCRNYALKHEEMDGVWGGMNFGERRAFLRAKRSAQATLKDAVSIG